MAIIAPYTLKNGPNQFEDGQAAKSIVSARVRGLIDSLSGIYGGTAPHTTSYTPTNAADAGCCVEMNSTSPTNLTFTIPASGTFPYDVHTVIEICRIGTGGVTIAAAGGVTLHSATGTFTLRAQWSTAAIRQRSQDEWVLSGDLT